MKLFTIEAADKIGAEKFYRFHAEDEAEMRRKAEARGLKVLKITDVEDSAIEQSCEENPYFERYIKLKKKVIDDKIWLLFLGLGVLSVAGGSPAGAGFMFVMTLLWVIRIYVEAIFREVAQINFKRIVDSDRRNGNDQST